MQRALVAGQLVADRGAGEVAAVAVEALGHEQVDLGQVDGGPQPATR